MLVKNPLERIPSVRIVGMEIEALLKGRVSDQSSSTVAKEDDATFIVEGRFAKPAPVSFARRQHNLPSQLTPFVGRENELIELKKLLSEGRLVTILAPGGMGKTRLTLELAGQLLDDYSDGVYIVELAPLEKVENIVGTIASAVDFQFYQSDDTPHQQLLNFFRQKHMLVVMDNFEHLLDGAEIVNEILANAPDVKIVATSRERLNLQGEVLFRISGMDFPDWETPEDALEYSAVKLFLQSAWRVRPDFQITADKLDYLVRICRLVQGVPLGILLAAAWVDMLSLEETAEEISESLDFLETETRDMPERHRSMRAVFESSWQRLSKNEQDVLMKLSVFRGGFTRQAAQEIAGANLRVLTSLVNKSFLQRDVASGRYAMHELMRQYAEAELKLNGQLEKAKDMHSVYYLTVMQKRLPSMRDHRQLKTLAEIDQDFDNIRLAWDRAIEVQNIQTLGDTIEAIAYYGDIRGLVGQRFISLLTEIDKEVNLTNFSKDECIAYGKLLLFQSLIMQDNNLAKQHDTAKRFAQDGYNLLQELGAEREVALGLAKSVHLANSPAELKQNRERALKYFQNREEPWGIATVLFRLGSVCMRLLEEDVAETHFTRMLSISQNIGNKHLEMLALIRLGWIYCCRRQFQECQNLWEQVLEIARQGRFEDIEYVVMNNLAGVLSDLGQYHIAEEYAQQAVDFVRTQGDIYGYFVYLDTLGMVHYAQENYAQALDIFEECLAITQQHEHWVSPQALIQNRLTFVHLGLNNLEQAQYYLCQAVLNSQRYELASLDTLNNALVGYAGILIREGELVRALEILYFTINYPSSDKHITDEQRWLAQLEAELPLDVVQAAKEHAATFELEQLVAELLEEFSQDTEFGEEN